MAEKQGTTKQSPTKKPVQKSSQKEKPNQLPPYNVVLMNDDDHTYDYVIQMLRSVFGYPDERGYQLAKVVDEAGRAIVLTTHKELAELKREQIQSFGTDHRITACKGSMSAIIEPA
ncbi:MAG TPA: ATP-dependent Clp protease adaptor ClpS [Tepidisphaeraceae bacterium]|jgi:ATP-dependent Clp protease adaptor protein ClpS|nr:ATP-dependent Clp protease adaptor ClpS [Tepidisphaeraceae bacterium]